MKSCVFQKTVCVSLCKIERSFMTCRSFINSLLVKDFLVYAVYNSSYLSLTSYCRSRTHKSYTTLKKNVLIQYQVTMLFSRNNVIFLNN